MSVTKGINQHVQLIRIANKRILYNGLDHSFREQPLEIPLLFLEV